MITAVDNNFNRSQFGLAQDIYNRRALLASPIAVQRLQSRKGDRKKKNLELVHEADKQIRLASDFGFSQSTKSTRPMSTASSVFIDNQI